MNLNPVNEFKHYGIKHILVAFNNTLDAATTELFPLMGRTGKKISGSGCGKPGIVLVNEFMTSRYIISGAETTFNYYSPHSMSTTSMGGELTITNRTGGVFSNFLKRTSERLGVSEAHISFAWKTFFVGHTETSDGEIIPISQLVFNMIHFKQSYANILGRRYSLFFVADYNTFGQMPNFSQTFQSNITHKDGNLHKEIPQPTGVTSGILPRTQEDGIKKDPRKDRIDKSKPMKTLQDVFDGYQVELDNMKFTHDAQLQHWLSVINDKYTKKILKPKQKMDLPIDYEITLDSKYTSYKIDNRNMPFEQPEQDQRINGIRSMSIDVGTPIPKVVDKLMALSKQLGQDALLEPAKSYKSNTVVVKDCSDKYKVKLNIKQITVPRNSMSIDTGPGESAVNPLTFTFQDGAPEDYDVLSIVLNSASDPIRKILENPVSSPEAAVVYGNREQATLERAGSNDYFKSGFSGLRTMLSSEKLSGTENYKNYGDLLALINSQATHYTLHIRGNPYIMNDLHRLPTDVIAESPGNAMLYKFPEIQPMYLKLVVKITPDLDKLGSIPGQSSNDDEDDVTYYYDKWMHMFSITNIIINGTLTHKIELLRTDEIM